MSFPFRSTFSAGKSLKPAVALRTMGVVGQNFSGMRSFAAAKSCMIDSAASFGSSAYEDKPFKLK